MIVDNMGFILYTDDDAIPSWRSKTANYQVLFFEKESGECPVEDFINSLDVKMSAKIYRLLMMISESGPDLREPYSKHLTNGIFELRARVASDTTRILYFFFTGRQVIVTNGFVKKTNRTPREAINKAIRYREEYIKREGHKNENA